MEGIGTKEGVRKRSSHACDSCRRRKIKCETTTESKSACEACFHLKQACTYDKPIKKRAKRATGIVKLEERMRELERLLEEGNIKNKDDLLRRDSTKLVDDNSENAEEQHFAESEFLVRLRNSNLSDPFTGKSFFSVEGQDWIQSRTGEQLRWDAGADRIQVPKVERSTLSPFDGTRLPACLNKEIIREIIGFWTHSAVNDAFPVLDTITAAELGDMLTDEDRAITPSGYSLFYLLIGFTLVLTTDTALGVFLDPIRATINPENCAEAVHELAPGFQYTADIMGIQAMVLLAIYSMGNVNPQALYMIVAVMTRMIIIGGGHLYEAKSTDLRYIRLRKLFWICYIFDKDLSIRTGQPPSINDDEVDLNEPTDEERGMYRFSVKFGLMSDGEKYFDFLGPAIRLSVLKSQIYVRLYSRKSRSQPSGVLLKAIRELDEDMQVWNTLLPVELRIGVFTLNEPVSSKYRVNLTRYLMLHLEYYHCLGAIHRAAASIVGTFNATHSVAEHTPERSLMARAVKTSATLCVEAARQTMKVLEKKDFHKAEERLFWVLVSYPLSAAVGLFCNILQNPSDPKAISDLDLIKKLLVKIEETQQRWHEMNKPNHVLHIQRFFTQLGKLGQDAINRAAEEQAVAPKLAEPAKSKELIGPSIDSMMAGGQDPFTTYLDGASSESTSEFSPQSFDTDMRDASAFWMAPMTFDWDWSHNV